MHALCCVTLLYPVVRALLLHLVSLYSRNASSSSFASPRWFVVGRYVAVSAAMKRLEGGQNAAAQKRKQKIEKQTLQNSKTFTMSGTSNNNDDNDDDDRKTTNNYVRWK
ncbi:hypothetical protein IWX46DRAFT_13560 [Phyllosticta citricarpa]|uniref:Secreted protein n=1 Tax=Phyllosticta citricarpa TaxID=55181 RepID=A0ABR1MQE7_9PEZI